MLSEAPILCASLFSLSTLAYDLATRFKLALDQSAANATRLQPPSHDDIDMQKGMIVFSSAMKVHPRVTPERLEELAVFAFNEMKDAATQLGLNDDDRPGVVTILHTDNTLYVSSSARGASPPASWQEYLSEDSRTEISTTLEELDNAAEGARHDRRANCGEILALHQWHLDNPKSNFRELSMNGGILVTMWEKNTKKGKVIVKKPYVADDPQYGCLIVLKALDLMYVEKERKERKGVQLLHSFPDVTLSDHRQIPLFPE